VTAVQLAAAVGIAGSAMYAVGDVFMLAARVGPRLARSRRFDWTTLPGLARRAALFDTLAGMPPKRLAAGALLGVFATPLVLAGVWLVYRALAPAGPWFAMPAGLLLAGATILGGYVHGSFLHLAEFAALVDEAEDGARPAVLARLLRQVEVLKLSYGVALVLALAGTLWYAVAVAIGATALPAWMAAVNPVSLTAAWLLPQRWLPEVVVRYTEGAGFNIAYLAFFTAVAVYLW